MNDAADALIVEDLDVAYRLRGRDLHVLRSLSFRIAPGEAYGLVGESGCGKSTLALAAVRYLPPNSRVLGGRILIAGRDVFALGDEEIRRLRATTMSMVHQDPARALNPSMRVGEQIAEIFRLHGATSAQAKDQAAAMLERVRIADGKSVYHRYAHQLSGGMQQRIAIAMAVHQSKTAHSRRADDRSRCHGRGRDSRPDRSVAQRVRNLRWFISHNLAVIRKMCARVGVLYAGALIEEGPTAEIFGNPRHPYTVALLRCVPRHGRRKDHGRLDSIRGTPPKPDEDLHGCMFAPRCGLAEQRCLTLAPGLYELGNRRSRCHFHAQAQTLARLTPDELPQPVAVDRIRPPLLKATALSKSFGSTRHRVHAVHAVSLELWPGETLGLVGESGSGKTTLARLLVGLASPDPGGVIELDGAALAGESRRRRAGELKSLQIVFQNPDSALNPSHRVRRLVGRALARLGRVPKLQRPARLLELMRSMRLDDHYLNLRPRELSGGMKQRVAIARAFAGAPRIVICDEPTSALDVSVQAAILNLLVDLQMKHRVSYLFISHDLGTVRYLSDRIAVLYRGRLMEIGPAERVFAGPHHPYTAALLSAVPSLDDGNEPRVRLQGEIASASADRGLPTGCVFHTRCPRKLGALCEEREPALLPGAEPGHQIRCHIPVFDLERRNPLDRTRSP